MKARTIAGMPVNPIGLGCMGLSAFYGPPTDHADAIALIQAAVDMGVDHFDTAEMYGMGHNEKLLGEALEGRRDTVRIATKFGPLFQTDADGKITGTYIDGSPANMRRAVENSLKYLRTETIDIYYLHRVDPNVPIEETVGAMSELVAEGKVRALGLSEPSGETLKKAHATHPIAAVQSEYSIFSRDIEQTLFPALRETGATLVAYSPLGRGMLTGKFTRENKPDAKNDFRNPERMPRFAEGAFEANLALVEEVQGIGKEIGASAGQVALAWVLGRGEDIVTIPGTTKLANLTHNQGARDVHLSESQTARLDRLADQVVGTRYNEQGMSAINR
ncbi:aldo/keto reductase [Hyphobacterium marinum]|uniref:Aldo/keto reductase n=1 Tax=Hyphobacterium marinum TaxID=3116574 RepID=A0ABU7LX28_9PROT|nr:aldo/keto reductase [Hyphobacterium sp. Y6023]MEE2566121.1 aldo/keto reductase [Hyphobacterium sp. Y6023]